MICSLKTMVLFKMRKLEGRDEPFIIQTKFNELLNMNLMNCWIWVVGVELWYYSHKKLTYIKSKIWWKVQKGQALKSCHSGGQNGGPINYQGTLSSCYRSGGVAFIVSQSEANSDISHMF